MLHNNLPIPQTAIRQVSQNQIAPTVSYARCQCASFPYFLALPRELRNTIYHFAMADVPTRLTITRHSYISDTVLSPQTLPSICFTSKQLQRESLPTYLQRTRIVFEQPRVHQLHAFISFVSQFERGFESIRMLSFYDVLWYGELEFPREFYPEALVSRCTAMTSLVLQTHVRGLLRQPFDWRNGTVRLYTKEEVLDIWGFEYLFEMKMLRHLRFTCMMLTRDLRGLGLREKEQVVQNVAEVLTEGFEAKGRKVDILIEAVVNDQVGE
ncbi:hypothetical protein BDW02DRAFT_650668 [Decorospora gaudefroyi]|uniref:F-box domain-containing protein n=1 Tax=Decorospora gaudefroyi TaxID=184978 RepID=A0A6A5JZ14_9PLEO|nr:hypothetical protein BDW02DRAFT_650668 [Decorospora gaudefroyi]